VLSTSLYFIVFGGAIGSMTPLAQLSVTAAGGITLPAVVATKAIGANDGSQSYTGPVLLVTDTTLSSQRSDPTTGGNITFTDATSSVDGAYGLTIKSDGVASFGGAVGRKTALSQFVVRGRAIKVRGVRVNGAGAASQSVGLSSSGAPKGGLIDLFASSGGLTLSSDLDAGAGLVVLRAGGSIAQTGGVIRAGVLTGASYYGSARLTGANQVGELATFSAAGDFDFHNAGALQVSGAVIDGTGIDHNGISASEVSLTTLSGDLTLSSRSDATSSTAFIAGGSGVQLSAAGSLVLGGQVAGDGAVTSTGATVYLESGKDVTQASNAGAITADTLTGSATGSVKLASANTIGSIGAFKTGGDFALSDTVAPKVIGPLTIGGAKNITSPTTMPTPTPPPLIQPLPLPTPTLTPSPLPGADTLIAACGDPVSACLSGVDQILTFRLERVVGFPTLSTVLSGLRSDPSPIWQGDVGGKR
jgi:hypothetical protein